MIEQTYELQDKPVEHCGVSGIIDLDGQDSIKRVVALLNSVNHRGRDAAGVLTFNHGVHCHKALGSVVNIYTEETIRRHNLVGPLSIAHCRYKTQGDTTLPFTQPTVVEYGGRTIGVAHNGNVPDRCLAPLRRHMGELGVNPVDLDSAYLAYMIATSSGNNWIERVQNGLLGIEGSYSLVIATDDGHLLGVRDPWGNRPLSYARFENGFAIASESVAFPQIDVYKYQEFRPGQVIDASCEGIYTSQLREESRGGKCAFEKIYFAYETSKMDGETVSRFRERLGRKLAIKHPGPGNAVTEVPESSAVAAEAYAHTRGIPKRRIILKRPAMVKRAFMQGEMGERVKQVEAKYNLSEDGNGLDLEIVDDSIVNGTTSTILNFHLKSRLGVSSTHWRSTAPPVIKDCEWGINMRDKDGRFIALDEQTGGVRDYADIAHDMGADSVDYLTLDELKEVIAEGGVDPESYCYRCFGGNGPSPSVIRPIRPTIKVLV